MSHPLRTRTFADTQAEDIAWLWPGRIACGKVTVVVADGGVGKSLLTSCLAAGVTRGHLGSDTSPGRVLLVNLEDGVSDTTRPRLEAHGADLTLVDYLDDAAGESLALPGDLQRLRAAVLDRRYRLVVLDPIAACLSPKITFALDASIRSAIMPVANLAATTGAAFLLVHHLNGRLNASVYRRMLGGTALANIARAVFAVGIHPEDHGDPNGRRVLAFVKGNLAGRDASSIECRLDATGKLEFGAIVPITADEMLTERRARGSSRTSPRRDDAVSFLLDELANGAVDSSELEARARARGISLRTYDRARGVVGVVAERDGRGWASRIGGAGEPSSLADAQGEPTALTGHEPQTVNMSTEASGLAHGAISARNVPEPAQDDASVRFSLLELDLEDATADGVLEIPNGSGHLASRPPLPDDETEPPPRRVSDLDESAIGRARQSRGTRRKRAGR